MTEFTISLAGVPIFVQAQFESSRQFCRDYLCDEQPELAVCVTQEDIENEREKSEREDELEGIAPRSFSDPYLETLAIYRKICAALLERDVLLFHGSVVAYEGRAYLFTAPSGTGKTTHSRLWLREIPGAYVLNGDKPLLRVAEDLVYACGTPWQGKEQYGRREILPLDAICIIERSDRNHIEQIDQHDALPVLIAQANRPTQAGPLLHTLDLIGKLGSLTRLYRLGCNMEAEAAHVSFEALVGRES